MIIKEKTKWVSIVFSVINRAAASVKNAARSETMAMNGLDVSAENAVLNGAAITVMNVEYAFNAVRYSPLQDIRELCFRRFKVKLPYGHVKNVDVSWELKESAI